MNYEPCELGELSKYIIKLLKYYRIKMKLPRLTFLILFNTNIPHSIKNPPKKTSEHNPKYNNRNFSFCH